LIEEARDLMCYPSILPFILSFDEPEIEKINYKIHKKRNYFFLNGLPGTGKHTFIKNHLMYCYGFNSKDLSILKNFDKGKIQEYNVNGIVILIVDELAYCTELDQNRIQKEINEKKDGTVLFFCSVYSRGYRI
jgi:hypothetical protein